MQTRTQGSHFSGLAKFHDISMIFPGFFSKFPGIFPLFLKYNFQAVLNINMHTSQVSFEQKLILSTILQISKFCFLIQ